MEPSPFGPLIFTSLFLRSQELQYLNFYYLGADVGSRTLVWAPTWRGRTLVKH